jgi:RNA polymerase sigma factor (TIGR02999 family)
MDTVAELITAARAGSPGAVDRLFRATYADLKNLARQRLRRSAKITTLDTTVLVHECYLRIAKTKSFNNDDRAYFLSYAARAMRTIVIDMLRGAAAARRGGGAAHVTLNTESSDANAPTDTDLIRINEALEELDKLDPRLVKVVEMKYFAGMSFEDIGSCLGVTGRTARRDWDKARALLQVELSN